MARGWNARQVGLPLRGNAERADTAPPPRADCGPPRARRRPGPEARLKAAARRLAGPSIYRGRPRGRSPRRPAREVQRAPAGAPAHGVAALQLQEVEAVGSGPLRHPRRHGRRHVEAQASRPRRCRARARRSSRAAVRRARWSPSMSHVGGERRAGRRGRARRRIRAAARGSAASAGGNTRPYSTDSARGVPVSTAPAPTATTRPSRIPSCGRGSRCRRATIASRRRTAGSIPASAPDITGTT